MTSVDTEPKSVFESRSKQSFHTFHTFHTEQGPWIAGRRLQLADHPTLGAVRAARCTVTHGMGLIGHSKVADGFKRIC